MKFRIDTAIEPDAGALTAFPQWPASRHLEKQRIKLLEPYLCEWADERGNLRSMVAPSGFVHNMASVPRPFWAIISPYDCGPAAIFHDYAYHVRGAVPPWPTLDRGFARGGVVLNRKQSDDLFLALMRADGIGRFDRFAAWRAVRRFGQGAWRRDSGN